VPMAIDFGPVTRLRSAPVRHSLRELLDAPDPATLRGLQGKLVLIGTARDPAIVTGWGEPRFGFEAFAEALNNMLTGRVPRWLGSSIHAMILLLMATIGAVLALTPLSRTKRLLALIVITILHFAVAVLIFRISAIILNAVYQVVALWLTACVVRYVHVTYLVPRHQSSKPTGKARPHSNAAHGVAAVVLLMLSQVGGHPNVYARVAPTTPLQPGKTATPAVVIRKGRELPARPGMRLTRGDRIVEQRTWSSPRNLWLEPGSHPELS
jgi:hypothetical protein